MPDTVGGTAMPEGWRKCSALEQRALLGIVTGGLPMPALEHAFATGIKRRWRFDFAWLDERVALEVEGGVSPSKSRHKKTEGFREDCHKYNAALILGWKVIRADTQMITHGDHVHYVRDLLAQAKRPTLRRRSPGVYEERVGD